MEPPFYKQTIYDGHSSDLNYKKPLTGDNFKNYQHMSNNKLNEYYAKHEDMFFEIVKMVLPEKVDEYRQLVKQKDYLTDENLECSQEELKVQIIEIISIKIQQKINAGEFVIGCCIIDSTNNELSSIFHAKYSGIYTNFIKTKILPVLNNQFSTLDLKLKILCFNTCDYKICIVSKKKIDKDTVVDLKIKFVEFREKRNQKIKELVIEVINCLNEEIDDSVFLMINKGLDTSDMRFESINDLYIKWSHKLDINTIEEFNINVKDSINELFNEYKDMGITIKNKFDKVITYTYVLSIDINKPLTDKLILEETDEDHLKCTICRNYKKNVVTNCGHVFCSACILDDCHICGQSVTRTQVIYL
jgi:hypothetical protein